MKKPWNTTKLIAVGSLTVLEVLLELAASTITMATGIMFASGVLTGIVRPLFIVNSLLIIDKFGVAFIFMTLSGFLTLPTALSGPPGFLPKLPILMSLGLIQDLIYAGLNRKNRLTAALTAGVVDNIYSAFVLIGVGRLLNVPGIDKALTILPLPMFVVVVSLMGVVGGYLGYLVYQKIKDTTVAKRIQK